MKIDVTEFLISLFLFNLTVAYEDGVRRDVHNNVPRHLGDLDEKISDIGHDAVTEQEYDGNKTHVLLFYLVLCKVIDSQLFFSKEC